MNAKAEKALKAYRKAGLDNLVVLRDELRKIMPEGTEVEWITPRGNRHRGIVYGLWPNSKRPETVYVRNAKTDALIPKPATALKVIRRPKPKEAAR